MSGDAAAAAADDDDDDDDAHLVDNPTVQQPGFHRPSPRPRVSARRKTASSLILRGHF